MWSELFLLNREKLLEQMDKFRNEFNLFYDMIENGDEEQIKEKMRQSTKRRALFDK